MPKSFLRFSSLAMGVAALAVALGLLLTGCGGGETVSQLASEATTSQSVASSESLSQPDALLAGLPWGNPTDALKQYSDHDGSQKKYADYGITTQLGLGDEKSQAITMVWGTPLGSQLLTGLQKATIMPEPTTPPQEALWVLLTVVEGGTAYRYLACEDKALYTLQGGKAYQLQGSENSFDTLRGLFVAAAMGHITPEQASSEAILSDDYDARARELLRLLPDTGAAALPPVSPLSSPLDGPTVTAPLTDGQQADALWWKTVFSCEDTLQTLRYAYLHDNATKLSYPADDYAETLMELLSTSSAGEDLGASVLPDQWVELVLDSDDKYAVRFYEKGVMLTYSHWKLEEKMVATLRVNNTEQYGELLVALKTFPSMDTAATSPLWLAMMNRGRITTVSATDASGGGAIKKGYTDGIMIYEIADPLLRKITVRPGVRVLDNGSTIDADYTVRVLFENRVSYLVMLDATSLYIRSSDVGQMLQYTLADPDAAHRDVQMLAHGQINPDTPNYNHDFAPTPPNQANPDTGKPVIYLYPTAPTHCTVKVDYPAFTYTYPTYNDGWQVMAYPDGRLVNQADGSEHYYLFWEGNQQIAWRFDSGFVVAGKDVEAFFREKLPVMGLTPREYNDFITWWVPKMQHNPYNLITFSGDQYEALAPLTVTPTPDSILRVHMVYKALSAPVDIPEQTLPTFERKGFTVVEWGGTVTR